MRAPATNSSVMGGLYSMRDICSRTFVAQWHSALASVGQMLSDKVAVSLVMHLQTTNAQRLTGHWLLK